jgi:hypothetical protein
VAAQVNSYDLPGWREMPELFREMSVIAAPSVNEHHGVRSRTGLRIGQANPVTTQALHANLHQLNSRGIRVEIAPQRRESKRSAPTR